MLTTRNYAQTILDAAKIHEDSYNSEAAKLETESFRRKDNSPWYMPDYASFYEKDLETSIMEACEKNDLPLALAQPISLSFYWQNDLIDWANETLAEAEQTVQVTYLSAGQRITYTGLIIGCDTDIGITIVDVNDKDVFLMCLRGPLAPNRIKNHPDYANGNYKKCYEDYIERIARGLINLDEHNKKMKENNSIDSGSGPNASSCPFGQ